MSKDIKCFRPKKCGDTTSDNTPQKTSTAPFSQCVGDYLWEWDGRLLTRERVRHTPDGTYSNITLIDGCIVEYGACDEPTYTPPYCSPNPSSCQAGSGASTTPTVSTAVGNTLVVGRGGLFAKTFINSSDTVKIAGHGTQNSPYVLSVTFPDTIGTVRTVTGSDGVMTKTTAGGAVVVSLPVSGVKSGTYNGLTINDKGIVTHAEHADTAKVKSGLGLTHHNEGDDTVITHDKAEASGVFKLGGYNATIDTSGHVKNLVRTNTIKAGTYTLGSLDVTLDEYGSITKVAATNDMLDSGGSFVADGMQYIYDAAGRIIKREAVPTSHLPIIDMHRVAVFASRAPTLESFGTPLTPTASTDTSVTFTLPDYVKSSAQIDINGAQVTGYTFEPTSRVLIVSYHNVNSSFTLTLRG